MSDSHHVVDITDNDDGTYTAKYTPTVFGAMALSLRLGQSSLPTMPRTIQIPGPDASNTRVRGAGIENPSAEKEAMFAVEVCGPDGKPFNLHKASDFQQWEQELHELNQDVSGRSFSPIVRKAIMHLCDDLALRGELLYEMLSRIDKDKGGTVEVGELRSIFRGLGLTMSDQQLDLVMQEFDKDNSGELDYREIFDVLYSFRQSRVSKERKTAINPVPGLEISFGKEEVDQSNELIDIRPSEKPATYYVVWIPRSSGPTVVEVKVCGEHVPGSPFKPTCKPSAGERLYTMKCVFGLEISTEDSPGLGLKVMSVRKRGAAQQAGILLDEYIKEIDGHYLSSNIVFEDRVLHRTPGDTVDVQVVSINGKVERSIKLIASAKGHTPEEVDILRAEAEEETPWEDSTTFDRDRFLKLHPNLKERKVQYSKENPAAAKPAKPAAKSTGPSKPAGKPSLLAGARTVPGRTVATGSKRR